MALNIDDVILSSVEFFEGKQAKPKHINTMPVNLESTIIVPVSSVPNNNFSTSAGRITKAIPNDNSIKEVKIRRFFISKI